MFDIFFSPGRAFARIKERPAWILPLVIAVVFNMLIAYVSARYVDYDLVRQQTIERMQERNMSEEQLKQATEQLDKVFASPFVRYGAPPVNALIISLIGVFFLAVVYNVSLPLLGGTGDFKRMLAVVANASLIAVPSAVVRAALVMMKKSAEVTTSLLLAAPGLKSGFLSVLLARIDVFAIWQLILMAIGLKVVFGLKASKAYLLVFAVWLVITVIFALLGVRAGGR
jgi:xanthosine utilization system XapX-like protein